MNNTPNNIIQTAGQLINFFKWNITGNTTIAMATTIWKDDDHAAICKQELANAGIEASVTAKVFEETLPATGDFPRYVIRYVIKA